MKITADQHAVTVQFKQAGKSYGHDTGEAGGEATVFPFDEQTLQPGETFANAEGVTIVGVREHTPVEAGSTAEGTSE